MNRVVFFSALFLILVGVVAAQVQGPQILYPAAHEVTPVVPRVTRAQIAAQAYNSADMEGYTPVKKMPYRPPREPGIREQIARKNAYDPVTTHYMDSYFSGPSCWLAMLHVPSFLP